MYDKGFRVRATTAGRCGKNLFGMPFQNTNELDEHTLGGTGSSLQNAGDYTNVYAGPLTIWRPSEKDIINPRGQRD